MQREQLKKAQMEALNEQELRERWALSQIQARQVAGQLEVMRTMTQRQGLAQSASNWFNSYFGNSNRYAGTGMNGYMNSNMNI